MFKKISFLISLGILFLPACFLACPVLAQLIPYAPGAPVVVGGIPQIVTSLELVTATIFGLAVVVCMVMAGILFLTAQGAPEKLNTAKAAFFWGVIGIIVGILAYSIIAIVGGILSGGSLGTYSTGPAGCPPGMNFHLEVSDQIPQGAYRVTGGFCASW